MQKELDDIKDQRNNHPVRRSVQSDKESRLAVRPDVVCFVRGSCREYLQKYDNRDILFVGEESCTDKKNTSYIYPDAFDEIAVLLIDECGLPEAGSPTEALLLFQEICLLVIVAWHQ